jgi:hypothetical protein
MGARKYQIYFSCWTWYLMHSFAALTREISCSTLEINLVFPRTMYYSLSIYIYIHNQHTNTLPHFGVVEHSVELLMGVHAIAIMQSSLLLWVVWALWPHATLRMSGCVGGPCCTTCAWWEQLHVYIYGCHHAYLDVYQASLTRRSTPKHACLQIVLYI